MYLGCSSLDVCLWKLGQELRFWYFLFGMGMGNGEIWLPLPYFVACVVVGNKGVIKWQLQA